MNDDVKAALARYRATMADERAQMDEGTFSALWGDDALVLAHVDGEPARTAAAVAAATALCAKQCAEALERSSEDEREVSQSLREQLIAAEARIAELEYERVGNHLVSFSAYDVLSRAERDRDALRAQVEAARAVAAMFKECDLGFYGARAVIAAMDGAKLK